jgi:hypothetical protein
VENQDGRDGFPFDHWQFDGDTLTISADNSSETLTPGEPLNLSIHGRGRTTSPTSCTFNGATCPTLRVSQPDPRPWRQGRQPVQATSQDQPSSQPAPSSPQYQPPSPQDQPSQDQPWARHQRDQRSWQRDRQPSLWDGVFSGWR